MPRNTIVQYRNERGTLRSGVTKGTTSDGLVKVEHAAGYFVLKHPSELTLIVKGR